MALLCLLCRRNYTGNLPISAPYQRPRLPSYTHPFSALLPFSTTSSPSAAQAHLQKRSLHPPAPDPPLSSPSQPVSLNKSHLSPSMYHLLTVRFYISSFIDYICTGFKDPEVLLELLPNIPRCLLPLDSLPLDPCSPRSAVVSFDH